MTTSCGSRLLAATEICLLFGNKIPRRGLNRDLVDRVVDMLNTSFCFKLLSPANFLYAVPELRLRDLNSISLNVFDVVIQDFSLLPQDSSLLASCLT